METIEQIYYKIKSESELPIGMYMYIIFNGIKYECGNSIIIDFHDDKESIEKMKRISEKEGFYAFFHSEKGKDFFEKNKKAIAQAWTNMVLVNADYGEKICKN